jgi:amidohydrolase
MERSFEMTDLVDLRRELHANPELAGEEKQTNRIIQDFIEPLNPTGLVRELGGTGLAAVFDGRDEGPSVMFRAEIDAVPVLEETDADHRSRRPGVSHTCGHDGHMAIAAGLAEHLHRHPPRRGRVVLLFQPAEETGAGALRVLDDERFESIAPDWIFALHNLPGEELGVVQIKGGPFAAGSAGAIFRLRGKTSHAAYPEQGRSPAPAVAQLIQEMAALPGSLAADDAFAKLTVIHVRIGEPAFGTTPGEAEVMATLRSDREEILERLRKEAVDLAQRLADAHGLELTHSWTDHFPVTVNDREAVAMVETVAEARGIAVALRNQAYPWSEDFGWFTRRFKGAIFGLGAGREHPALHSPGYDFPDDLIPIGIGLFEGLIERLLG